MEENRRSLQIPSDQRWSISVEGFLQKANFEMINYTRNLERFLKLHEANPPSFIDIGNLVTRLDGMNGYANLEYDKETGLISINEYNINKICKAKGESADRGMLYKL